MTALTALVTPEPPRRRKPLMRAFCIAVAVVFLLSRSAWHDVGGAVMHLIMPLGILIAAQFKDYAARVPRFWPRLSQYSEPTRWEFSPQAFRRSLTEVVWFVIAAVAVHALHDLRSLTTLPSLFALY